MYAFARRLAWVAAVVLPLGETWRRWGALWVQPTAYLDDIVMGVLFLVAAIQAERQPHGARWLAAAYGCAVGIMSLSLIAGIANITSPDPSGVSGVTAVAVKVAMMGVAIAGMFAAIAGPPDQQG